MELFDLTKIMFEKPSEWESVNPSDKRKWYFLCQRRFAIQHPIQANALQKLKIEQSCVMDFWQRYLYNTYRGKTPHWMFISGAKKVKEKSEAKLNVSESSIDEYSRKMRVDKKSVLDAIHFYPDLMVAEIKAFLKSIDHK